MACIGYVCNQARTQRGVHGWKFPPPPVRISKKFNWPSEIMTFNGKPWKITKRPIFYFYNFLTQKFPSYIFQLMQFFLCWWLYSSKVQISASLKYNISLTSSVEYRCLRILRLLTLETRFLGADLIEVFKILRGFENLHSERFFQVIGDGARRGTVSNC